MSESCFNCTAFFYMQWKILIERKYGVFFHPEKTGSGEVLEGLKEEDENVCGRAVEKD